MLIVTLSLIFLAASADSTGVRLSLQGREIVNNSFVDVDDIGESDAGALLCHTDREDCCTSSNGNWYAPDGSVIRTLSESEGSGMGSDLRSPFAVSRGGDRPGVVRLFQTQSQTIIPMALGSFYCEVPDMDNVIQRIFVNILDIGAIKLTSTGDSVNESAGVDFSLECSITILPYPLPHTPGLQWQFSPNNSPMLSKDQLSNTSYDSTTGVYQSSLTFFPLQESHAGNYTCRLEKSNVRPAFIVLSIFPVQISVNDAGNSPTLGESYTLVCNVVITVSTYKWLKNGVILENENERTLQFPFLALSDAGNYTCEVDVGDTPYRAVNRTIHLDIPPPSVVVTSNKQNPIRPVRSNVTLTCDVELGPGVDIAVCVNVMWTNPHGLMIGNDTACSGTNYTNSIIVSIFGNNVGSGTYTCAAHITIVGGSTFVNERTTVHRNTTRLTTGVYLSLMDEILANDTRILIDEIGVNEDDLDTGALTCYTDRPGCCHNSSEGEWYLPDNTPASPSKNFIVSRETNRTVQLTRLTVDVTSPLGEYCCLILDASGSQQMACVNVDAPISHQINDSQIEPVAGQTYQLYCQVSGIEVTSYQWLKDNELLNEMGPVLIFSPLHLENAGLYTCSINGMPQHKEVPIHIPAPRSVMLSVSKSNYITVGSSVNLTCTVEMSPRVIQSDLSLLVVDIKLLKDGMSHADGHGAVTMGTTYTYTKEIPMFERLDSGNYSCNITVRSLSTYLISSQPFPSDDIQVSTGVYLSLKGRVIVNNSKISASDIGEEERGALLCYTDHDRCCDGTDRLTNGHWYFPNGSVVPTSASGGDVFVSRGPGTVRLHRTRNASMPFDVYRCEISDVAGIRRKVYIDVTKTVTIDPRSVNLSTIIISGGSVVLLLFVMVTLTAVVLMFKFARSRSRKNRGKYRVRDLNVKNTDCIEMHERSKVKEDRESEDEQKFMDSSMFIEQHEKPVPLSEFSSHVERLHSDRDNLFEMEYKSFPAYPLYDYSSSMEPHNTHKNRFVDILPYDYCRVKLIAIQEEEGSDYINASYLDGYNKPKAYIGAQGPLPDTVGDFWRMVWEKRLPTIVMLTRCHEGRKKCEQYWPENVNESIYPDNIFTVTLLSSLPFAEYTVRKFRLHYFAVSNSSPMEVTHFHFTGWPDHGVPQNGVVLLNFIKRVRIIHPFSDPSPLLVHCSAGVGRTGAFIVLDSMLERMQVEEDFNIYKFVKQLRRQRVYMVQTQSQYNFIHDVLNEFILCGDTEIMAPNLRDAITQLNDIVNGETGFSGQFKILNQMCTVPTMSEYAPAKMDCNFVKNRYSTVLPNDFHRVALRGSAIPGSDYINASFIDGYRQRKAYIATQTPMENTVNDFWAMIWEQQSRCIVMLCRMMEDGEEQCCRYLPPSKGGSEVFGKVMVKLVSQEISSDVVIRYLELSEYSTRPPSGITPSTVMTVTLFQFLYWSRCSTPQGTSAIIELMGNVNRVQMSSGNTAITVMCNDGVGRTGTFICIHTQLERLKTEGIVDFFQSIKSARIQRAGLVSSLDQYILCHNLVADYIDGFDIYANFKDIV